MEFKAKISSCEYCNDKYLQTRMNNNICGKDECKAERKRKYNKIYKDRKRKGTFQPTVYKPLIIDTAMPEVRLKNRFILGLT